MIDVEIIKLIKDFTKSILDGNPTTDQCFKVCSPLATYLSFLGIECTLTEGEVQGYHHFWITLTDGRIIDPTANQFGLLNQYLRKQPSYYRMYTKKDYDIKISKAGKRFIKNVAK